ncbi:hypothetical protein [Roseomonas marmotae]|uniref:Uncharacterized protein n=1 Tax=Roseomonas marmotae TaxID=2768161 RepID=A0ABS3K8U8_9PROT|nr:hypothetical protein [Roseomonas marmotae]MBO1073891.1 hypothetical protein [Roseomonas marmotae]QTI78489.1 hypothetical protein IAI58_12460 [Roseomonas marmotae]
MKPVNDNPPSGIRQDTNEARPNDRVDPPEVKRPPGQPASGSSPERAEAPSEPTPQPPETPERNEPIDKPVPADANEDLPEGQYGRADILHKPRH